MRRATRSARHKYICTTAYTSCEQHIRAALASGREQERERERQTARRPAHTQPRRSYAAALRPLVRRLSPENSPFFFRSSGSGLPGGLIVLGSPIGAPSPAPASANDTDPAEFVRLKPKPEPDVEFEREPERDGVVGARNADGGDAVPAAAPVPVLAVVLALFARRGAGFGGAPPALFLRLTGCDPGGDPGGGALAMSSACPNEPAALMAAAPRMNARLVLSM
jgi:hypothetical protein